MYPVCLVSVRAFLFKSEHGTGAANNNAEASLVIWVPVVCKCILIWHLGVLLCIEFCNFRARLSPLLTCLCTADMFESVPWVLYITLEQRVWKFDSERRSAVWTCPAVYKKSDFFLLLQSHDHGSSDIELAKKDNSGKKKKTSYSNSKPSHTSQCLCFYWASHATQHEV